MVINQKFVTSLLGLSMGALAVGVLVSKALSNSPTEQKEQTAKPEPKEVKKDDGTAPAIDPDAAYRAKQRENGAKGGRPRKKPVAAPKKAVTTTPKELPQSTSPD